MGMEFGFYLTILIISITPAFLSVLFGLIRWEFKNRDLAYGIAFIAAITLEIFLFRLLCG